MSCFYLLLPHFAPFPPWYFSGMSILSYIIFIHTHSNLTALKPCNVITRGWLVNKPKRGPYCRGLERPEVGIYKREILRKKKENTLSTKKTSRIQEKKKEKNAFVQEKKKENTIFIKKKKQDLDQEKKNSN